VPATNPRVLELSWPGEILIKNFDAFLPDDLEPFLSLLSENEPGSERMS
jgi:hypothetical protein